jgi:16S rRNA processing protein RimM
LIFVGKIKKIRGNKGEVVVDPSPNLENYSIEEGDIVILKSAKYQKEKKVDYIKEIKGYPVLKFSDTNTINEAYKLVGYSIYTTSDSAPASENNSLLNFQVVDMEGQVWGSIKEIDNSGFNPLLEVESPAGEMIYVPFANEIVKQIDEKNHILTINPPEGLKDLNKP